MTNENFDLKTFSGRLAYAMEITNNSNQTSFAKSIGVTPQTKTAWQDALHSYAQNLLAIVSFLKPHFEIYSHKNTSGLE